LEQVVLVAQVVLQVLVPMVAQLLLVVFMLAVVVVVLMLLLPQLQEMEF
jgi:hypothetical protein